MTGPNLDNGRSNIFDKNRRQKKLFKLLSETETKELLLVIWHVRQIQSGRPIANDFFVEFPQEYFVGNITSNYFFHQWMIETLVNLKVMTPYTVEKKKPRKLDLRYLGAFTQLMNALHELENASDGVTLRNKGVLTEIYRLTRRQFEWQRGFYNAVRLFRYSRIYVTDSSKAYFLAKYGLDLERFSKFCFAVFSILSNQRSVSKKLDFTQIGISEEERDLAWKIVSVPLDDAPKLAARIRAGFDHVGYAPSFLRERPCIEIDGYIVSPLVELIFNRTTETLFYDFAGDGALRDEFGRNFELYVREILEDHSDGFSILPEMIYGKPQQLTPDIFLKEKDQVMVAIELKARRLSAPARFGEDPIVEADSAFEEIAKGYVQLWKYAEDSLSGLVPAEVRGSESTLLTLICLDEWLGLSGPIEAAVLAKAHALADRKKISNDSKIRRRIRFSTVDDLEYVLSRGSVRDLVTVLDEAVKEEYRGWMISSVRDKLLGEKKLLPGEGLSSTSKIGEMLGWWNEFPYQELQ